MVYTDARRSSSDGREIQDETDVEVKPKLYLRESQDVKFRPLTVLCEEEYSCARNVMVLWIPLIIMIIIRIMTFSSSILVQKLMSVWPCHTDPSLGVN